MKTTNFAHRSSLVRLWVLYCLALLFVFVGCNEEAEVLWSFSRLENEALKYGTVSVGAARVIPYNDPNLEESRKQLIVALCKKRENLLKDPNMVPQSYAADFFSKYLAIVMELIKPGEKSKSGDSGVPQPPTPKDPTTYFKGLSEVFHAMIAAQPPQPSEIELIGLRMAALKFIESEIEDVNLAKVYPVAKDDYGRFVVSLDLTAWVRGEARAALVYIDLYPYKADKWCDRAAKILECEYGQKSRKEKKEECTDDWETALNEELNKEKGGAFRLSELSELELPEESEIRPEDKADWIGYCHRWLARKRLFPRIIQVERMGQGEYLISAEGSYSGTEFQLGGAHPAGLSGTLKAGAARKAEGMMAKVRPLSLAFVAGNRRAGWLFMPSRTEAGRMPPTERRLRMVVDVPKALVKLGIHIHKAFLDSDLRILPGATFKDQMANLNKTRATLTDADGLYEEYMPQKSSDLKQSGRTLRHYRLIKSRIRNLLDQGWSQETVVDIPAK